MPVMNASMYIFEAVEAIASFLELNLILGLNLKMNRIAVLEEESKGLYLKACFFS